MQQVSDFFGASTKVLTVAELTRNIRSLLEARIGSVWVQGEISNYKEHASGHRYFTLKDSRAQIACVIFRSAMVSLRQPLADGAQVQVYGNLTVFEARGQYQLSVEIVQPRGLGLLQAKFEALKRKLEAEGLFDPARKKRCRNFPKRIGVITSPTGAAIRDILNVLLRRARCIEILINPVRVQGSGAAAEIAVAISELSNPSTIWPRLDLIVLARGGGSIEDLWEFNEESVARAIAAADVPIVSAVGHEIDFTIADFVADLRAPTPSAAAELIVPDASELERRLEELRNCLHRCLRKFAADARMRLSYASERALGREIVKRVRDAQQELDWIRETLQKNVRQCVAASRQRLSNVKTWLRAHSPQREIALRQTHFAEVGQRLAALVAAGLDRTNQRIIRAEYVLRALAPEATLQRGYSITTDTRGNVIRSVTAVKRGMRLRTRVRDGEIESTVASDDSMGKQAPRLHRLK